MSRPSYYEHHVASPAHRASRLRRAELLHAICAPFLTRAGRVVDLGAGTGIIRRALEERTGRPIVGFEIDPTFIEVPERMVVADLLALPVADGSIDFGIANHVYEHVADLDRFLGEIRRALAPGGRLYLTAGNRFAPIEPHYRIPTLSWWPTPVAERILRWSGRGERYDDIRFTTYRTLVDTARRQGLAVEDVTDDVLRDHLGRYESVAGRVTGRAARALPTTVRRRLLTWLSPQWFFFLRRADEAGG